MEPLKVILLQDHKNPLDNQGYSHGYEKRLQKACCLVDKNLVHKEPAETGDDKARNYKEQPHQKHIHENRLHTDQPLLKQRDNCLFLSLGNKVFTLAELKHYT